MSVAILLMNFLPQRQFDYWLFFCRWHKTLCSLFPVVCLFWVVAASDRTKHTDSECFKTSTYSSVIVTHFFCFSFWHFRKQTNFIRNLSKIASAHSAASPWHVMPQLNICSTMCCWSITPGRRCPSCSVFALLLLFPLLYCQLLFWLLTTAKESVGLFPNRHCECSTLLFCIYTSNDEMKPGTKKTVQDNQRESKVQKNHIKKDDHGEAWRNVIITPHSSLWLLPRPWKCSK